MRNAMMNKNTASIWAKVFVGVTALVALIVIPVIYHYSGAISWFTLFIIPLSTAPTTFLATVWIISLYEEDHEATEKLKRSLEWNHTVISNLSGAFVIHNEDFSIKYISDTMVRFCGTSDRSDIHNMSHQFLHLNEVEVDEMRERLMSHPDFVNYDDGKVYDFTCLKGNHKKVKIIRRWFNDGFGNRYLSATFTNVTDLIQTQLDLEKSQAKQEEFSAHLEESMSELEEKRDQEKQMLAVIGHELRTPAAMLSMAVDELEDLDDGKVDGMKTTINHLIQVLDDLKSVANPRLKIAQDNESISICDVMESIFQYVKPLAEGTDFTINYSLKKRQRHKVKMSQQALRQVMTNLVKNAIKHSGGDHIDITLENVAHLDNAKVYCIITVSDNGYGIHVEERDNIFNPFIRGSNTTANGTGLGLSIIKGLVEEYNGTIEYHPNPIGRGAMFVIRMELDIDEADTKTTYNRDHVNMLQGKKILVAEDNLTIQMMTKAMLEKKGATVVAVSNGREGVELLGNREYFNIIISDIFMPEMEGYEFVTIARAMGFRGPIIGATAAVLGEETDRMLESGADICLEKPLNVARLNKELASLM